tara:strand:- start:144 stop:572 length:429 start_codon:yes stop_codon:yes gene_type:complete
MERASEDLEHSGAFNKEEILETLGLIVMADSVRWDYIREFLQEDQGCELVPVAASYFKRHKRDEELTSPERFIASGHGKKTAGFVSVTIQNDHLVVCRIGQRQKMANGAGEKFREYAEAVMERRTVLGIAATDEPLQLNTGD